MTSAELQDIFNAFVTASDRSHHADAAELGRQLWDWSCSSDMIRTNRLPKISGFAFRCLISQLTDAHNQWKDIKND